MMLPHESCPPANADVEVRMALRRILERERAGLPEDPASPTPPTEPTKLERPESPATTPATRPRVHRPTWLTEEQLRHGEASLWFAEQHGITSIPDALRWYAEHHGVAAKAPLIREAIEEFFRIKADEGCGVRTMQAYHTNLRRFAEVFGDRLPVDVSHSDLSNYFITLHHLTDSGTHDEEPQIAQMGTDASADDALPAEPGFLEIQQHGEAETGDGEIADHLGIMSFGEISDTLRIDDHFSIDH